MRLLRSSASPRGSLRNALRFFGASAILDTDRNALPFLTRLGLESRRRDDAPPSAAPQQILRHFARHPLDFCAAVLLYYTRLRASARRQTIVRELIGSVKLLRVSRQSPSTPERRKQFAYCKAVVSGNVRNFKIDDTLQRKCIRTSSLRISIKASHGLQRDTKERISFSFRLPCGSATRNENMPYSPICETK